MKLMGNDKLKHIAVGFAISLVTATCAVILGFSPWFGFVAATIVGAGKEVMDDHGPGHEEFMDFFATGGAGLVPSIALDALMGGV